MITFSRGHILPMSVATALVASFAVSPNVVAQSDLTARNAIFTDGIRGTRIQMDGYSSGNRAFLALDSNSANGIASGSDYLSLIRDGNNSFIDSAGAGSVLTVNAAQLIFQTGGAGRLTFDANGLMTVNGNGAATSTTLSLRTTNQNNYINLFAGSAMDAVGEIAFERGGPNDGNWYYGGNASGQHIWRSGGYARRMVLDGSGRLGIGTTAPKELLQIGSQITFHDGGWKGMFFNAYYESGSRAISTGFAGQLMWDPSEGALRYISASQTQAGQLLAAPTEKFVITNSGNVGIGTSTPTHKLSVSGSVRAKEVIVETTGWSDYVFADDYQLAPLSEIERHIRQHKHLPGIPSAAQVAEQGVSIGEMQARLLAQVEELTLRMITQEKQHRAERDHIMLRLTQLEAENQSLRADASRVSTQPSSPSQ
jgi:hypothetical protein